MPLEMIVIMAVGLPVLLYSFIMFDRLVKAEYAMNRIAWEADGKPRGFFWNAPECSFIRSNWREVAFHFYGYSARPYGRWLLQSVKPG
jgi:hypothetical protein